MYFLKVALNLLLENEKNDLDQLVSKMVSYSITYKNVKSNPLSSDQSNEATSYSLGLAFDPPIADFVNFKVWAVVLLIVWVFLCYGLVWFYFFTRKQGYKSGHYVLALAMKQVLVHEVKWTKFLTFLCYLSQLCFL